MKSSHRFPTRSSDTLKCWRPCRARTVTALLLGLGFGLTLAPPSYAMKLSRVEAVRRAADQNPQVAAARAREAQARAKLGQANAARWPQLQLSVGVGPSLKAERVPGTAVQSTQNRYGDVGLNDLSVVIGGRFDVIQPLYTFGKIDLRREAAELGVQAEQAQTEMTRADVSIAVARLYEGHLFARDAVLFYEETLTWVERTIQETRDEIKSGIPAVSESDLLRLLTARGAVELALNQAKAAVEQTRAGLAAYLGLSANEEIEPKEAHLEAVGELKESVAKLTALAQSRRPELVALSKGASAHDNLAAAQHAGYKPDVVLWGFLAGAYTPGRDWVESRYVTDPLGYFDPGLLLGVRWQLQGDQAGQLANEELARSQELSRLRDWVQNGLPAEVRKSFEDVQRADRDIKSSKEAVQKARRWVVMASADYSIGMGGTQELVDALEAYVKLRTAMMDARYRHNVGMAELAKATGTLTDQKASLYARGKAPRP